MLSPTNNASVREAFESAIPGLDILEVIGHDWEGDAFSRGTWSMYRPGQLTRSVPAARMPEGQLVFAGADLARGWTGFVDGAIESGLTAAIAVRRVLHS